MNPEEGGPYGEHQGDIQTKLSMTGCVEEEAPTLGRGLLLKREGKSIKMPSSAEEILKNPKGEGKFTY